MITTEECGGTFDKGRSDDDANAEAIENFGVSGHAPGMAIVCDDCYNAIMAEYHEIAARAEPMDRQEQLEFKIVHGCGGHRLFTLWRLGGHLSIRLWKERYGWACLWIFWPTGRTFKEINDATLAQNH